MKFLNPFFHIYFFINFSINCFSCELKCLKIYQLNLFKRIKKDSKKKACERWQQHGREHYKNLSEDEKQTLAECRKKCYKIRKNAIL